MAPHLFESGVVKIASGDPHWRNLTAMDDYYQDGPLPSWPGWYVQKFPHWYHAGTVLLTFFVEFFLVWAVFLLRKLRIVCFAVVTAFVDRHHLDGDLRFSQPPPSRAGHLLIDDLVFERLGLRRADAVER